MRDEYTPCSSVAAVKLTTRSCSDKGPRVKFFCDSIIHGVLCGLQIGISLLLLSWSAVLPALSLKENTPQVVVALRL